MLSLSGHVPQSNFANITSPKNCVTTVHEENRRGVYVAHSVGIGAL